MQWKFEIVYTFDKQVRMPISIIILVAVTLTLKIRVRRLSRRERTEETDVLF